MEKIISIIIPIYNVESYIKKTIESLLKQISNQIEVILVDDGSLDNSTIIAKYYADNNYNINYYHKENGGLSSARNFGLAKARGQYVHFLDGDDFVNNIFYDKVIQKINHSQPDIIITNLKYHFPGNTSKDYELKPINLDYNTKNDLIYLEFPIIQTKIYRREYLTNNQLIFQNHLYEDITFFTNSLVNINSIETQTEAILYYTQRADSIMRTTDIRVKDIEVAINNVIQYYKDNGMYDSNKKYIEVLAVKNLLLASVNRVAQIPDVKQGSQIIESHWDLIKAEFPNWRKNKLLKKINYRTKFNQFILWCQHNRNMSQLIFKIVHFQKNRRKK